MRAATILISLFALWLIAIDNKVDLTEGNLSLHDAKMALGADRPSHVIDKSTPEMIKEGEDLIHLGRTIRKGKRTPYISKYYQCTSCHNTEREDPDLSLVDPEARLNYAIANKLPYLQGSTFWGMVNHETWYNGDYVKKYGDLVVPAHEKLTGSIQLCAEVCAQGRKLEPWEMNSILAYLWTLEVKLDDLDLSTADQKVLKEGSKDEQMSLLNAKYLTYSPATFVDPPNKEERINPPLVGRADRGQAIYELSCQHCHREGGVSDLVLDQNTTSLKWLEKHLMDRGEESVYEIVRKGTYSEKGHREYMPNYTAEKMSDQQLEDLVAYIRRY